jgi:GDPmannose 4,6-dehydratase
MPNNEPRTAIITGITGQDGAYLSRLLLEKGYAVKGMVRSISASGIRRLDYLGITDRVELVECDLTDMSQVVHTLMRIRPSEIYNLAAQSSVSQSFQQPIGTMDFNIHSVLNLLETIRLIDPSIRFYQASSSEMFGRVNELPITEDSHVHPLSPYAISKVTGHYICINYRESYGLHTNCGILFNHESYLRGENFFVKKLVKGALEIKHGQREYLEFGNIRIRRDFGWSEKYVEAMWLMLQQEVPDDYVICSGRSISLEEVVQHVFRRLGIDPSRMRINPALFRPTEIEDIYGSNDKARQKLKWDYNMDFKEVVDRILKEEEENHEANRRR